MRLLVLLLEVLVLVLLLLVAVLLNQYKAVKTVAQL
jgi:hypothetical protein